MRVMNLDPRPIATRFWSHVDKSGDCWLWTGFLDKDGYGKFSLTRRRLGIRKMFYAHRWAYVEANGPIPARLQLDHLCRQPSCVNPSHIEVVTMKENLRRGKPNKGAHNAQKTHCKRGHPLKGENLYIWHRSQHYRRQPSGRSEHNPDHDI